MVRENKRMKLEGQKATDMQKSMEKAMNLLEYQRKVIEEKTAEVEQAVMKADLPSFQNVSPADLDGIPNNLHNMVKEVVETDGSIALKDGHFECEICKNNWSKVVPRPNVQLLYPDFTHFFISRPLPQKPPNFQLLNLLNLCDRLAPTRYTKYTKA